MLFDNIEIGKLFSIADGRIYLKTEYVRITTLDDESNLTNAVNVIGDAPGKHVKFMKNQTVTLVSILSLQ